MLDIKATCYEDLVFYAAAAMAATCHIELRLHLLPLSRLSVYNESLCLRVVSPVLPASQNDALVGEISDAELFKMIFARERGKIGFDQLLSIKEVTILIGCHRTSFFEYKELFLDLHRPCGAEIEDLVFKSTHFSRRLIE